MKKKYLFSLMALFAVTLVSAGYLVNSFVLTTDVYEPFQVQYVIIGLAAIFILMSLIWEMFSSYY